MKKIQGLLATAVASLAFAATTAQAGGLWNFSYSGDGVSAFGKFETVGDDDSTPSTITSVTGRYSDAFVTNGTIDGVVALNTDGGFLYDNKFGGSPLFSNPGLLFDIDGTRHVNLYSVGTDYYNVTYAGGGVPVTPVSLSVSAVPEPGSASLLLAGFGALALLSRRRKRS